MLHKYSPAYLLSSIILLGLAITISSVSFMQVTSTSSATLNAQNYEALAKEAATAGLAYVNGCVSSGNTTWADPLSPSSTDGSSECSGTTSCENSTAYNTAHPNGYFAESPEGEWRSRFCVTQPVEVGNGPGGSQVGDGRRHKVVSKGIVELVRGNTVVKTYEQTKVTAYPSLTTSVPISKGESVTDIKNDQTDCAIANGKLYCWGSNGQGQVGDNTRTNRESPTLVQGDIAGKTVTRVSVGFTTVCAVADGLPYCWGSNSNEQLGIANNIFSISDDRVLQPTNGVPRTSSGALSGRFVTDIGTASPNNPANLIWPFAYADEHSCALTEQGAVACWGDGDFRQQTGGGLRPDILPYIGLWYRYPDRTHPTLVKGYSDNTGPFAGKKAERVGASSHDSCILAEGRMYCWGVPAPIHPLCWVPPVGLFSGSHDTVVPLNPCIGSFSNGYDVSALSGLWYTMNDKVIDPSTWEVSANEACMMANMRWVCFGTTPAFTPLWLDAWGAPRVTIKDPEADVTNHDNGDSIPSWGTVGLFCAIDRGEAKCAGNLFNGYTGTGKSGYKNFQPLINTTGLEGKVPTKIAAGQDHGCTAANGQLVCWGRDGEGRLGNGPGSTATESTAVVTGDNVIGTEEGTYAATGAISTGKDHSCGVANGTLFCWGKNEDGQLGTGNASTQDVNHPQSVPYFAAFNSVTKVSAGDGHTCAIAYGKLYCWGRNSNGQLGLGDTDSDHLEPELVAATTPSDTFYGKRVTDVSASPTGTCAVADGRAYCWGLNSSGQIGDDTVTQRTLPVQVTGGSGVLNDKAVTTISQGTSHTCAVANADLYCWGNNTNGRTGFGHSSAIPSSPEKLTVFQTQGGGNMSNGPNGMTPSVSSVSAGSDFTCAIVNSLVSCWGNNLNGRTGRNTSSGNTLRPRVINSTPGSYFATSVSAGNSHACALIHGNSSAENGNIYCWGNYQNGRLGAGQTSDQAEAQLVNGGETIDDNDTVTTADDMRRVATSIDVGESSSCAVANAVIICWGDGTDGKLGDGATSPNTLPDTTDSYRLLAPYIAGPIY